MKTTRREFVKLAALAAAGAVASACGATPVPTATPVPPTQTPVIVKQTVIVEQTKIVEATKIVERVVQVTPQVTPLVELARLRPLAVRVCAVFAPSDPVSVAVAGAN